MTTLVIVQRLHQGHRLAYVRHLVLGARDRRWQVQLWTSPEAPGSPEWLLHLDDLEDAPDVRVVEGWSPASLTERLASAAPDRVVVPDGDWLLPDVARGRVRCGAQLVLLIMRPRGQGSPAARAALASIAKAALRWSARRRRDVVILELASSVSTKLTRHQVRDPVTARTDTASDDDYRAQWGLDADVHWFGVIGALDERKNLDLVGRALTSLLPDRGSFGLFLAGRPSPQYADKLSSFVSTLRESGVRVSTRIGLLDDDEFGAAVRLVDTMVIAHSNEGPSGVLAQCVLAGTPVVGAGAKSLKHDAEAAPHLVSWAPLEPQQLRQALARAMDRPRAPTMATSFDTVPAFVESFLGPGPGPPRTEADGAR